MGTPEHLKANPMDQRLSRGGEPMMTNWYNRNPGSGPTDSENQNIDRRMQGLYHQTILGLSLNECNLSRNASAGADKTISAKA